MSQRFFPGGEAWFSSDSPVGSFSAFFEDVGATGYFYAYDRSLVDRAVLDAAHIYNASNVADRERESVVEILWSRDGLKAALLINDYPHGVIDFATRCAYCRTGFPPAANGWTRGTWTDDLM